MELSGVSITVETDKPETGRLVYGTRTQKWYLVGETDRDYFSGLTVERCSEIGEAMALSKYLSPSLI